MEEIYNSDYIAIEATSIRSLMDLSIALREGTQLPSCRASLCGASLHKDNGSTAELRLRMETATMLYVTIKHGYSPFMDLRCWAFPLGLLPKATRLHAVLRPLWTELVSGCCSRNIRKFRHQVVRPDDDLAYKAPRDRTPKEQARAYSSSTCDDNQTNHAHLKMIKREADTSGVIIFQ